MPILTTARPCSAGCCLDCHNGHSQHKVIEISAARQAGEDEWLINEDDKQRIYMRAVRNADGKLLGYYELHEPFARPSLSDR